MPHALLSPSAAHRWLECTPSAIWESKLPDVQTTVANEGSLCHRLAELLVKRYYDQISRTYYLNEFSKIEHDSLYSSHMHEYAQSYTSYVISVMSKHKDAVMLIEQKIDLSYYVPDSYGTVDFAVLSDNGLDIIDLKYGKGVLVDAFENAQMMLYALAVLKRYEGLYDVQIARLHIYQPRIDNYGLYEIKVNDLLYWANNIVKDKAVAAFKGKGEFKAGTHCRFCKAKPQCNAFADYNLELIKNEVDTPEKMSVARISEILDKGDEFINWIKAVKDFALDQSLTNKLVLPDYKIVEGRSTRKYINESEIIKILKADSVKEDLYLNPARLKNITELEKNIGAAKFYQLANHLVEKPKGAPTLVKKTDKRPDFLSNSVAEIMLKEIKIE